MCWFLFNRSGGKTPWTQAMAALGNAAPILERDLDTFTTGQMGILVRPSVDQDSVMALEELERALSTSEALRASGYRTEIDSTDHPWVILRAGNLPDLMNAAQVAGDTLVRTGIGDRVIAGVIPFTWKDRRIYWLYQPRLRGFTPFAPNGKTDEEERDHDLEVRMGGAMNKRIPVVKDLSEWYPVWDLPF